MNEPFGLWGADGGNLVATYESENAVLADISEMVSRYGPSAVDSLFLGYEAPAGRSTTIARGAALGDRALVRFPLAPDVETTALDRTG